MPLFQFIEAVYRAKLKDVSPKRNTLKVRASDVDRLIDAIFKNQMSLAR